MRRLIEHVGEKPAIVFGASSGGVVALTLLARHAAVVRTLVPFESPAMHLLPDGERWINFFLTVYEVYRQSGAGPALALFRERTFAPVDQKVMSQGIAGSLHFSEVLRANITYWFEHELRQ